jgi:hypothetical protein
MEKACIMALWQCREGREWRGGNLQSCNERFRGFEAALPTHLICDACQVAEEITDRVDLLLEGGKPVIVGDHAAQPFPDTLLGIQLGRVCRLRLEDETTSCFADNLSNAGPLCCAPRS